MSATITHLRPAVTDIPTTLRYIAEEYAAGQSGTEAITMVIGLEVFHLGTMSDEHAACHTVFDLEYAKAKIIQAALDA